MYGREAQLRKLKQVVNDTTKPKIVRKRADRTYRKIVEQMRDPVLMAIRLRLIRANKAGDGVWVDKITKQLRDYEGAERESGL